MQRPDGTRSKSAVVAFRVKNGMARKAAVEDANMTVEDYMAAPVDRYRFMAEMNAPAKPEPAKPARRRRRRRRPRSRKP